MQYDWLIVGSRDLPEPFLLMRQRSADIVCWLWRNAVISAATYIRKTVTALRCTGMVRTSSIQATDEVWEYVNQFAVFAPFINEPLARDMVINYIICPSI